MAEEVPLDRESIKLLASDTRLDILKALGKRRMTVSELAASLRLGKSTVFEHVTKLVDGGLVTRIEDPAREWVYYELSHRAKRLLSPGTSKIVLLFSTVAAVALLAVSAYLVAQTMQAPGQDTAASENARDAFASPATRALLAGAAGDLPVTGVHAPDPEFHLLTPAEVQAYQRDQELPASALRLQAEPREAGAFTLRVPALPAGDYALHVRGSDGLDNRGAMPRVRAAPATPALPGGVFVIGADDPQAIPLALADNALATTGRLVDPAAPPAGGDSSGAVHDRGYTDPAAAPLPAHGGTPAGSVLFRVAYTPPGGNEVAYAEGNLTAQAPRVVTEPSFLYLGEASNLSLSLFHPYRGVLPDVNLTAWAGTTLLGAARTNATGQAVLALDATPQGTTRVTLRVGNATVHEVPVRRGLVLEFPTGLEPHENSSVRVRDRLTGDPVSGVSIVLDIGYTLPLTDGNGLTLMQGLPEATYVFRASRSGYTTLERFIAVGDPPTEGDKSVRHTPLDVEIHPTAVVATLGVQNPTNVTVHLQRALAVDGVNRTTVAFALAPGEIREVTFVAPLTEGTHTLTVPGAGVPARDVTAPPAAVSAPANGVPTEGFSATRPAIEPDARDVPAPAALAALAALAAAALVLRRRRA